MTNEILENENYIDYNIHSKYCSYCCDESPNTLEFNGKCIIYIKADGFFAINGFTSSILNSPTFIEIFNLLDTIIEATGDYHHVFFEGIQYVKKINEHIHQIDVILGS